MLVVRAHNFVGQKPVNSANNGGGIAHVGRCTRCSATATRVNYRKKAGKGEYIVNPNEQLLCISSVDGDELRVGPVAGSEGSRPAVVKVDA